MEQHKTLQNLAKNFHLPSVKYFNVSVSLLLRMQSHRVRRHSGESHSIVSSVLETETVLRAPRGGAHVSQGLVCQEEEE